VPFTLFFFFLVLFCKSIINNPSLSMFICNSIKTFHFFFAFIQLHYKWFFLLDFLLHSIANIFLDVFTFMFCLLLFLFNFIFLSLYSFHFFFYVLQFVRFIRCPSKLISSPITILCYRCILHKESMQLNGKNLYYKTNLPIISFLACLHLLHPCPNVF
jgi:hypothetical protein